MLAELHRFIDRKDFSGEWRDIEELLAAEEYWRAKYSGGVTCEMEGTAML